MTWTTDTVGTREITVSGSEIEGAGIAIRMGDVVSAGTFDAQGTATAATGACVS
ncbi:hypothetical protein N8353_11230 [Octadecabacter sp.]|nr:hypothetical protein [Octadecabacter sp.]